MLTRLTLLSAVLMAASPAWANPMAVEVLRLRQLPNSRHVQVTFAVDTSAGKMQQPSYVSRDGQKLTGAWKASPFTTNTGSGLRGTSSQQFCDCNVGAGLHTYEIGVKTSYGAGKMTGKITVGASTPPTKLDAGAAGDLAPWHIPDPTGVQGWDCRKTCSSTPQQDTGGSAKLDKGGSVKLDAKSAGQKDAAVIAPPDKDKEDSGCSMSGRGTPAGLMTLALLAFALIRRRR